MLAVAKAHGNCRFWLLDLRPRPLAGPDLNERFRNQFSPQIAAALDSYPLFYDDESPAVTWLTAQQ